MNYIEAIGLGFPAVQCHAMGDGSVYETLVHDSGPPIPSKQTLDEWIAANPTAGTYRWITVLAFRNRFTKAEKVTLELAALDNPAGTAEQRQLAAALRSDMKDTDNAAYIDLDRADTRAGVIALETYGLIGSGRALQILDAPVQAHERPSTNFMP